MGYEQLSLNGFIQEMKNVTYGAHPRRFCFVLGAGASRTSGIKSGQELVRVWDKELRERNEEEYLRWRNELKITDENMSNFYSYYYEKRFHRCPADGLSFIEGIMESAKPSAGYVMLAHLLTETPHNVVVTTNFDHLTEDAVTYYAQKTPLVIGHEALSRYVVGQQVRSTIIKIHRDLLFDPKSRTEDIAKLPESWMSALSRVFENYHPVFVGYAGNDKSLMDFLIKNSAKFANDQWKFPYWLLYKNDSLDGKVKEFLEKSEGIYISHDGFDEVMIELGAAFDYHIPDRDTFLEDAIERYKLLKDAIDAFADKETSETDRKPQVDIEQKIVTSPDLPSDRDDNNIVDAIEKITGQSEQQNLYHRVSTYIKEENYDEAISLLNMLIEMESDNVRYRYTLGRTLFLSGKYNEAIKVASQIIEIDSEYALAYFIIGKSYSKLEQHEEALKALKKAAECDPNGGPIYEEMGEALKELGRIDEALEEFRKAVELSPEWAMPHYDIAEIYEDRGEYGAALEEYRNAAKLDPEEALYHLAIAMVLGKTSDAENALTEYRKAIELSPEWSFPYYMMAQELEDTEDYEQALDVINKAISIESTDALYYYCLGSILHKLDRTDEAIAALSKAEDLEEKPKDQ